MSERTKHTEAMTKVAVVAWLGWLLMGCGQGPGAGAATNDAPTSERADFGTQTGTSDEPPICSLLPCDPSRVMADEAQSMAILSRCGAQTWVAGEGEAPFLGVWNGRTAAPECRCSYWLMLTVQQTGAAWTNTSLDTVSCPFDHRVAVEWALRSGEWIASGVGTLYYSGLRRAELFFDFEGDNQGRPRAQGVEEASSVEDGPIDGGPHGVDDQTKLGALVDGGTRAHACTLPACTAYRGHAQWDATTSSSEFLGTLVFHGPELTEQPVMAATAGVAKAQLWQ